MTVSTFIVIHDRELDHGRSGQEDPGIEITAADFAFLYELADEIGAPRPHRVYVAPGVNAAAFYDLSVLNFLLPSKKNLLLD